MQGVRQGQPEGPRWSLVLGLFEREDTMKQVL